LYVFTKFLLDCKIRMYVNTYIQTKLTLDEVVESLGNNSNAIEARAKELGVATGLGWYCDAQAICDHFNGK
jgi:hypothetical protein